jgi:hypothetical protein
MYHPVDRDKRDDYRVISIEAGITRQYSTWGSDKIIRRVEYEDLSTGEIKQQKVLDLQI